MPAVTKVRPLEPRPERGFTLAELVVVIVLLGVLAAAIVPRFLSRNQIEFQGAYDEALSAVRHAHKVAIAGRASVFVQVTGSSLAVCYGNGTCGSPVPDPSRGGALLVTPASGVSITGASFSFDALGRPSAASVVTVAGGGLSRSFTVEAETGHVHP
jgi:prepilin-type N-terminal cleavage/methylation domain-containing protein